MATPKDPKHWSMSPGTRQTIADGLQDLTVLASASLIRADFYVSQRMSPNELVDQLTSHLAPP